jgi:hypothetical protein
MRMVKLCISLFTLVFFIATMPPVEAAASSPQKQGEITDDFMDLTSEQIRTRLLDVCVVRQAENSKGPDDGFAVRCGCYAGRVVKALSPMELDHLRSTGSFNPSAQAKAQSSIQACKVRG